MKLYLIQCVALMIAFSLCTGCEYHDRLRRLQAQQRARQALQRKFRTRSHPTTSTGQTINYRPAPLTTSQLLKPHQCSSTIACPDVKMICSMTRDIDNSLNINYPVDVDERIILLQQTLMVCERSTTISCPGTAQCRRRPFVNSNIGSYYRPSSTYYRTSIPSSPYGAYRKRILNTSECDPGFTKQSVGSKYAYCIDVNECNDTPDVCGENSSGCRNTPGGYSCTCSKGFVRNETECVDLNECDKNPCAHICTNTIGSYECACRAGYKTSSYAMYNYGRPFAGCSDIDECHEHSDECTENDQCLNKPGSYVCIPPPTCEFPYMRSPAFPTVCNFNHTAATFNSDFDPRSTRYYTFVAEAGKLGNAGKIYLRGISINGIDTPVNSTKIAANGRALGRLYILSVDVVSKLAADDIVKIELKVNTTQKDFHSFYITVIAYNK